MRQRKRRLPPMTRSVEMVETENLVRALRRLQGDEDGEWRARRALYHAITIVALRTLDCRAEIRKALELP